MPYVSFDPTAGAPSTPATSRFPTVTPTTTPASTAPAAPATTPSPSSWPMPNLSSMTTGSSATLPLSLSPVNMGTLAGMYGGQPSSYTPVMPSAPTGTPMGAASVGEQRMVNGQVAQWDGSGWTPLGG